MVLEGFSDETGRKPARIGYLYSVIENLDTYVCPGNTVVTVHKGIDYGLPYDFQGIS